MFGIVEDLDICRVFHEVAQASGCPSPSTTRQGAMAPSCEQRTSVPLLCRPHCTNRCCGFNAQHPKSTTPEARSSPQSWGDSRRREASEHPHRRGRSLSPRGLRPFRRHSHTDIQVLPRPLSSSPPHAATRTSKPFPTPFGAHPSTLFTVDLPRLWGLPVLKSFGLTSFGGFCVPWGRS